LIPVSIPAGALVGPSLPSPRLTPPGSVIFTTYDTSLLNSTLEPRLFRRDQVWFLEKDEKQASQLYSLADFDEREDASFMRRYLNGIYGAVPDLQVWLDSLAYGLISNADMTATSETPIPAEVPAA